MNGGRVATLIVPHDVQIGDAGDCTPSPRQREEDLLVKAGHPGSESIEVR